MATSQTAHLSRTRDNQRRSRARRKEYLNELETKYRKCEAVGAEASVEIQTAARRVLGQNKRLVEENERLRAFLAQLGFAEAVVEGIAAGTEQRGQDGQVGDGRSARLGGAERELEVALASRRACRQGGGDASRTRQRSAGSESLVCAGMEEVERSRSLSATSTKWAPPQVVSSAEQLTVHPPTILPRSQNNLIPSTSCSWQTPHQWTTNLLPTQTMTALSPSSSAPPSDYTQQNIYTNPNASSCQTAASIIHTLNPRTDREELERALGCGNGAECTVDNTVVFELMDRYGG